MKKKILLLISSIALLSSCGDMLDLKPFNTVQATTKLSTSKDVEALMVGAYAFLGDGDVYGGNLLRDAELMGDAGEVGGQIVWDGTFVDPNEIWTKAILITNTQVENTYVDSYRVINICNTVLANLDVVIDAKRDRVEGEAKFIRGTVYFELVRMFARAWNDTQGGASPATNPGVPIVLEPNTLDKINRNTVAQVYTQVITDLTEARDLLPAANSFFATTYSASAMLSRVHLMQENWVAAATEADRVIQSGEFELLDSYADNFNNSARAFRSRDLNDNASLEDVFSIQVTTQLGINNMNTFFSTTGRGDILVLDAHTSLYEAGDDRLDMFYGDTDEWFTGKWENPFGNVNIIRLAEMYLTRAEANFRDAGADIGDSPLNDINAIRDRAGASTLGSVDIDDILNERHLELAFEGHMIHDLKRTGRSVGARPFHDPKLVYPIPNRERILNPDITQNASYGN